VNRFCKIYLKIFKQNSIHIPKRNMNMFALQPNAEKSKSSSLQVALNLSSLFNILFSVFSNKKTAGVSTCGNKDLK
ncbi:MAG: hypothetical protein IKU91_01545, partial [Anaerotignum sp.]|nr:hypothetical protein [Anaerotignum sp.]